MSATTTTEPKTWKVGDKVGYHDRKYFGVTFVITEMHGYKATLATEPAAGEQRRILNHAQVALFTDPPEGNMVAYKPFPAGLNTGALVTVVPQYLKARGRGNFVGPEQLLVVIKVDYRKETATVYPLGGSDDGYHWTANAHLLTVVDADRLSVQDKG